MKTFSILILSGAVFGCSMLLAAPSQASVFARSVAYVQVDGGEGGSEPDDDKPTEPPPPPPVKPTAND